MGDSQSLHETEARNALTVPCRSILCPTDLSETGNLAIPVAYQLAAPGGRVHLMHVCEPPFLGNPLYGPFVQGYAPTSEETAEGESRVLRKLHNLKPEETPAKEVHTEFHLVHGVNVAKTIETEAARLHADVVVLGTHGRTGFGRVLMGSVATDVVKKKGLAVILVHQDFATD